jgi:hypothetical protein
MSNKVSSKHGLFARIMTLERLNQDCFVRVLKQ